MAETVTARAANQHFSRRLRGVAEGKPFVITHRGRSVARPVPEPAPGAKRLTPGQERALEESIACALALRPPAAAPGGLPPDWPRDRDGLHDEVPRGRSGGR
jgi:antitoxin (DNA-binding transcriptional repressor) of toxin-antitoxin stability system